MGSEPTNMINSVAFIVALVKLSDASELSEKFTKDGINPDVVNVNPSHLLRVQYKDHEVTLGNTIPVPQAATRPLVQLESAVSGKLYTLAMVDPDAPSRKNPSAAQWNHWLTTNIKALKAGGDLGGNLLME